MQGGGKLGWRSYTTLRLSISTIIATVFTRVYTEAQLGIAVTRPKKNAQNAQERALLHHRVRFGDCFVVLTIFY